ncbi:hypothetical protein [Clostridium sp.]
MDNAQALENVFHEVMLRECKGEEAAQWENTRHSLMSEAIQDSCNYYGQRNCSKEYEREK